MNKILALILSLAIISCCATGANAIDGSNQNFENSYAYNDMVIIFDTNTSDYAKSKIIANFTLETNSEVEPRGLTCTLFGHKLETGVVTTITHKVKSASPRCLKEIFNYEICSRCDYSEYTLVSQRYINCC